MIRVYTVTCHNVTNHGAMLQEWALLRFLTQHDCIAKVIDYQPNKNPTRIHRSVPGRYDKPLVKWFYLLATLPRRRFAIKRRLAFDAFYARYLKSSVSDKIYYSIDQLRENSPVADVLVAGSDQIWNTEFSNGNDPTYYLDFGSAGTKRISYAASFATGRLNPHSVDFVRGKLANFNAISVRESSGLDILNDLGYNGVQVCDPVFLVEKSDFDVMNDSAPLPEGDFIVVYDFETSPEVRAVAKRLSKIKGYKIASVGPQKLNYAHYDYSLYGPDAFVWLIRNAKCVISNSFHGSAFALIFSKNFFVVNRSDGLNRRMTDLLEHYGISNRLVSADTVTDEVLCADIDYDAVGEMLRRDISFSQNWLLSQL